ncbi:hypothetical protein [Pseudomonas svalbardensis]|uniref:hypothetical protein n=1 Tax=Pseudomonas svalbardensis TaxID=3042029 RepID=UPI0024B36136|nr:hypothetical protein [Pseudomonas sp. PMCC200367]
MTVEKSFIAELASDYGHLHFPRLTHGREVTIPVTGFFDFSPTDVYVSDTLFAKKGLPGSTLQFYFYSIGGSSFHHMFVITPGPLFGRLVGIDENDCLTAMEGPTAGPKKLALFQFFDHNGEPASLDNPKSNTLFVTIRANDKSLTRSKNSPEGFIISAGMGIQMNFSLKIIKRNVDSSILNA